MENTEVKGGCGRTVAAGLLVMFSCLVQLRGEVSETRRIPIAEYVDKMKAGWIGQMAGVGWGASTEFRSIGWTIPEYTLVDGGTNMWHPSKINQFAQDDIYVEMTFVKTLEDYGFDVSMRQAGIDFANSGYELWHANDAGRKNIRMGIAPPDSGHPKFNKHSDDIDYQIEADYSGLIAPGMPNIVIELGEKFGRMVNYGDGLYAGQFVGAMYAEAFFESDPSNIIMKALQAIPAESQYAGMVRDVVKWSHENPDWTKTWQMVEEKYHRNPQYTHGLCSGPGGIGAFSIDAKLNGAYIIMGLLYGRGDPDRTIVISCACGQDSDCNPANSGGVLFTTLGYSQLPEKFKSALNPAGKFSHTPYTFPALIDVCEKLARQAVIRQGGRIEKDAAGNEIMVMPVSKVQPSVFETSWDPGPVADTKLTDDEVKAISIHNDRSSVMAPAVEKFAPGWKIENCGPDMDPGLRQESNGKKNVLITHPLNKDTACVLKRSVKVPAEGQTFLKLTVGHHPAGDWELAVRVNGEDVCRKEVSRATVTSGWLDVSVDLARFAGREIKLELLNKPTGWMCEAAYWAAVNIETGNKQE